MERLIYKIINASLTITILTFGCFYVVYDTIFGYIPIGVLFACSIIGGTFYIKAPKSKKEAVEAILGPDPYETCSSHIVTTGAHRGAGLDAPENTLVAFKLCAEKGVNLVEFDVSLTADDVPIIFHDETLEHLTDRNDAVKTLTWEQISKVDISVKHPHKDKFHNTYIPKLDDAVKQLLKSNQKMFIDLKGMDTKIVGIILDLFEKYPDLYERAVVSSFYPHLIYLIRRKNPHIVCSLAWRPYVFTNTSFSLADGPGPNRTNVWYKYYLNVFLDMLHEWTLTRITYYLCGISIILLHKDAISGKAILDWREKGVRVVAWTVNHPVEKQHFSRVLKIAYLTDTLIGEATAHLPIPS